MKLWHVGVLMIISWVGGITIAAINQTVVYVEIPYIIGDPSPVKVKPSYYTTVQPPSINLDLTELPE